VDRSVLLVVSGLGAAGWLCAFLLSRATGDRGQRGVGVRTPFLLAAVLLPAVTALGIRLAQAPAASAWGLGVLLGAAGALLGAWPAVSPRRRSSTLLGEAARIAAPRCLALVAVAFPLLWTDTAPVEVLVALPVGWAVASAALFAGLLDAAGQQDPGSSRTSQAALPLISGLGFAATLAATAALGTYRADAATPLGWSAAAIALGAGVPFVLFLGVLTGDLLGRGSLRGPLESGWRVVLSGGVLLGLADLVGQRVIVQPTLVALVGMGLTLALVLWWLGVDADQSARPSGPTFSAQEISFASALAAAVVLGAFMVAFYLLAGYGVGVMLLAAWPVIDLAVLPALHRESAGEPIAPSREAMAVVRSLPRFLLFGVMLLLYRLFTTRFDGDLRGATLTDEFALFGFLVGAVLPALLAGFFGRAASASAGWSIVRLVLVLSAAAAVPGLLLVLWGVRTVLALLAGLALATTGYQVTRGDAPGEASAGGDAAAPPDAPAWATLLVPVVALVAALALTAWTHPVVQLAEQTRAARIRLVGWVLGILIVAIAAADYGGRAGAWRRRRGGRLGAHPSPGGGAR